MSPSAMRAGPNPRNPYEVERERERASITHQYGSRSYAGGPMRRRMTSKLTAGQRIRRESKERLSLPLSQNVEDGSASLLAAAAEMRRQRSNEKMALFKKQMQQSRRAKAQAGKADRGGARQGAAAGVLNLEEMLTHHGEQSRRWKRDEEPQPKAAVPVVELDGGSESIDGPWLMPIDVMKTRHRERAAHAEHAAREKEAARKKAASERSPRLAHRSGYSQLGRRNDVGRDSGNRPTPPPTRGKKRATDIVKVPDDAKRRKWKENATTDVIMVSSDEEGEAKPSRLTKKRGDRQSKLVRIPASEFSPPKEKKPAAGDRVHRPVAKGASPKQGRRRPLGPKNDISNFEYCADDDVWRSPERPRNRHDPAIQVHADDSISSFGVMEESCGTKDAARSGKAASTTRKPNSRGRSIFDGPALEEVPVVRKPSARKNGKISVTAPPKTWAPNPERSRSPLKLSVSAIPAFPQDLEDLVIHIQDDEPEKKGPSSDATSQLADRLSRAEIAPKTFYTKARSTEAGARTSIRAQSKRVPSRQVKRRTHRIFENSDDDDEDQSQIDIRLTAPSRKEVAAIRSLTFDVPKHQVIAKIKEANIELKGEDFGCLRGSRWLSDEVMNAFVALVNARNKVYCTRPDVHGRTSSLTELVANRGDEMAACQDVVICEESSRLFDRSRPRTHVFNTFFFARLTQKGYDYHGVKRWLKRAGREIPNLDLIMFPINISNLHWVLAAVDLRGREFLYFDSTFGSDSLHAIPILRRWLYDEVFDKHGEDVANGMDIDSWKSDINPPYLPRQSDDGSCGIFTLYMAEYLERGVLPNFEQGHIRALRQRTALFLRDGALPET